MMLLSRTNLLFICLFAAGSDAFVPQKTSLRRVVTIPSSAPSKGPTWFITPTQQQRNPHKMVSYEDLIEKIPSKPVIEAVDASRGGKVVASDVAATAGVSLSQARKDLTALASITRGDIAVDKEGELIYSFPKDLNGALASNSAKYKAIQTFRKAWPALFWAIRVSFGVTLLASLFAIFSTIFFLSQSGSSDNDRRRGDRGGGMSFGYSTFWGPSPFDFFYYRPYGYYSAPAQERRDPEEMGFLESVFSYIFGDGNPNEGLEERRLGLVANMIRKNKGAVTAEQLAPYCDDAPDASTIDSATYVDESFVLPIVTALNGEPQVTDDGEIVYVFPELQVSASSSKVLPAASKDSMILRRAGIKPEASAAEIKQVLRFNGISTRGALEKRDLVRILEKELPPMTPDEQAALLESDPNVLQEREWKFSLAPDINKVLAGGLGVVNLGGALYLGNLLGQYALYGVQLPSYMGTVQTFFPLLLAYAVLFNTIPLARNFWIKQENEKIRRRNQMRRKWQTALKSALSSGRIGRKIAAAKKMRQQSRKLGASKDIVFDTSKPIEETEKKKQRSELEEFDKLLEKEDKDSSWQ